MSDSRQSHYGFISKMYNISVIGPPKSGKSCFCNRFALPHPDFYRREHVNEVNAVEYRSEIVNCSNWLYWGCVSRQIDEYTVIFRVIEQTQFWNAQTPTCVFEDGDRLQEYINRSCVLDVSSERKLRYICKDQFGCEDYFEKEYFPSGKVEINGFILVYDANSSSMLSMKQADDSRPHIILQDFLTLLLKMKKPVVLALSKYDLYFDNPPRDVIYLLQKSHEFKKVHIIETSSHDNVNVDQTFLTLVKLIDGPRSMISHVPSFLESAKRRKDRIQQATVAFCNLLSHVRATYMQDWHSFMKRYSQQSDVVGYMNLVGTSAIQNTFDHFKNERLALDHHKNKLDVFPMLNNLIPNLNIIHGMSRDEVMDYLKSHDDFSMYFKSNLGNDDNATEASLHRKIDDYRVEFSRLYDVYPPGSQHSLIEEYTEALALIENRTTLMAVLETNLHVHRAIAPSVDCQQTDAYILPGQPFEDALHLIESLGPISLPETDVIEVYKNFQHNLKLRARETFLDLLVERTDMFVDTIRGYQLRLKDNSPMPGRSLHSDRIGSHKYGFDSSSSFTAEDPIKSATNINHCSESAPPRGLKEAFLNRLNGYLSSDIRYQAMKYLPSERQMLVTSYFELLLPSSSTCLKPHGIQNGESNMYRSSNTNLALTCTSSAQHDFYLKYLSSSPSLSCSSAAPFKPYVFQEHPSSMPSNSSRGWSLPSSFCIDHVFKLLAYSHLPMSPRCLESSGHNSSGLDLGCCGKSQPSPAVSLSLCPSPLPMMNVVAPLVQEELSIAVSCVCTDVIAAQSAIHLLSCAGFSLSTPLSSVVGLNPTEFDGDPPLLGSADYCRPVTVTTSWPLSTDRLPLNQYHHSPVPNGQVCASLLALHTLINSLLSIHRCSTPSSRAHLSPGEIDDNSQGHALYHGYIFILTIPPNDPQTDVLTGKPMRKHDSALTPSHVVFHQPDDTDENILTPRPTSTPFFFADNSTDTCDQPSNNRNTSCENGCQCCLLCASGDSSVTPLDCACEHCCNCTQFATSKNAYRNSSKYPSDNARYLRYRSWDARISAVRSAINLIHNDSPCLVLLTESNAVDSIDDCCGGGRPLHLAPDWLISSSNCNTKYSDKSDDDGLRQMDSASSPDQQQEEVSDAQYLTNTIILDRLIHFLNRCWRIKNLATKLPKAESPPAFQSNYPHHVTKPTARSRSSNLNDALPHSAMVSPSTSMHGMIGKSSSPSLFSTASSTGRRAIQTANQALRYLSGGGSQRRSIDHQHHHHSQSNLTSLSATPTVHQSDRPIQSTKPRPNQLDQVMLQTSQQGYGVNLRADQPTVCSALLSEPVELSNSIHDTGVSERPSSSNSSSSTSVPPLLRNIRLRASTDRTHHARTTTTLNGGIQSRSSVPECHILCLAHDDHYAVPAASDHSNSSCPLSTAATASHTKAPPPSQHFSASSTSSGSLCSSPPGPSSPIAASQLDRGSTVLFELNDESMPFRLTLPHGFQTPKGSKDSKRSSLISTAKSRDSGDVPTDTLLATHNRRSSTPLEDPNAPSPDSKELEFIYEDLDVLRSKVFHSSIPILPNLAPNKSAVSDDNISEHIYEEPLDFLPPSQTERFRCCQNDVIDGTVLYQPSNGKRAQMNSWMVHTSRCRPRERQRSFSTPEGCAPLITDTNVPVSAVSLTTHDTAFQLKCDSTHTSSNPTPPIASNNNSNDRVGSYPNFAYHRSSSRQCDSALPGSSFAGSGQTSDDLPQSSSDGVHPVLAPRSFPVSQLSCLSINHHHHAWHHADCPHKQLHRAPLDQLLAASGSPVVAVSSGERCTHLPNRHSTGICSAASLLQASTMDQRSKLSKSPFRPCSTSFDDNSAVFINSGDFPTQSHPYSVQFPCACTSSSTTNVIHRQYQQHRGNTPAPQNKDSKWKKRRQKFNIFQSNRSSGSSSSLTTNPSKSTSTTSTSSQGHKAVCPPSRCTPSYSCKQSSFPTDKYPFT